METIDRIELPTTKYFREHYLIPNKPVIITGLTQNWPAASKWSPEYLSKLSGDRPINISSMTDGDYTGSKNIKMKMREYIRALENTADMNEKLYLGELPISKYLPELLDDIILPDYFDETEYSPNCFLYIGQYLFSQLHYHTFGSALLSTICGYKKVRLYAPDQTQFLYKYPWHSKNNNMSKTTSLNPDAKLFPKFSNSKFIDLKLNEGESLFIPIYWWHGISNEVFNIAVVAFWGEKLFRRPPPAPLALDYIYDIVRDSPEIAAGIFRKLKRSIGLLT